jgi:hypothetical protein
LEGGETAFRKRQIIYNLWEALVVTASKQ